MPVKYNSGPGFNWDPIKGAMGEGLSAVGRIPWVQALGKVAGPALEYADIPPEELLSASIPRRAVATALDPGGTLGYAGELAKGTITGEEFDPVQMRVAQGLAGTAIPDLTPLLSPGVAGGIMSPALKFEGNTWLKGRKGVKDPDIAGVAKSKLHEGAKPLAQQLRKDTPSGARAREGVAEYLTNPEAQFRLDEDLGHGGLYSDKHRMAYEKRQRPDLDLPNEKIEVLPTAPRRTTTHELGHASYMRQGEAQKQAFRNALDSGQLPEHPKMSAYQTYRDMKPGSDKIKGFRDNGQFEAAAQWEEGWYDENFNQWMADVLEGRVSSPTGVRDFTADELLVDTYFKEFINTPKAPTSPLAGASQAEIDPLLRVLGQQ